MAGEDMQAPERVTQALRGWLHDGVQLLRVGSSCSRSRHASTLLPSSSCCLPVWPRWSLSVSAWVSSPCC